MDVDNHPLTEENNNTRAYKLEESNKLEINLKRIDLENTIADSRHSMRKKF
jgi:hypothetical protein